MAHNPRLVIEGLRSGVPYREMAKTVVFGREKSIENMVRLMESVEQNHAPKSPSYVIRANYGEGKTHLLHSLWGAAEERNWVVSMVSLSRETPLDRLDQLYPKLMESTFIPGSSQPGITSIVTKALNEPQFLAAARALDFSPRITALLDNLVSHNEGFESLLADISGAFLSVSDLRKVYRQNYGKSLQLPKSTMREEIIEYFRLVDWFVQRAGFQGWLILFDELELIGKLGRAARSRAYASMGRLITANLPHTLTAWALASNFYTDVLIQRNDREESPHWLVARPKEEALAPQSEVALDALLESKPLAPLSQQQIQSLLLQIYELHQEAYEWPIPFTAEQLYHKVRELTPTQDTRLRTWVRLSLTVLDVWYQYQEDPMIVHVDLLTDSELSEEPEAPIPEVSLPEETAETEEQPALIERWRLF